MYTTCSLCIWHVRGHALMVLELHGGMVAVLDVVYVMLCRPSPPSPLAGAAAQTPAGAALPPASCSDTGGGGRGDSSGSGGDAGSMTPARRGDPG